MLLINLYNYKLQLASTGDNWSFIRTKDAKTNEVTQNQSIYAQQAKGQN